MRRTPGSASVLYLGEGVCHRKHVFRVRLYMNDIRVYLRGQGGILLRSVGTSPTNASVSCPTGIHATVAGNGLKQQQRPVSASETVHGIA